MFPALLLLTAVVALSYANGANDTFKGVATLYGSGISTYRVALAWAIASTMAGSLLAAVLAQDLVVAFSGKGLVPAAALAKDGFMLAVAIGATVTVFVTALLGIPISTTHSLIGALLGAGLSAAGTNVDFSALGRSFLLPLALSPFLSMLMVISLTRGSRLLAATLRPSRVDSVAIDAADGVGAKPLRLLHFLSAGAVGFARGTNDAPKIAGIALAMHAIDLQSSTLMIALAMALGGLFHSRRIAQTMAQKIVPVRETEGALANLVTSALVVSASASGLPVSTTHVSVGSLFGLAATSGAANWGVVRTIVASWFLTLPAALAASALAYAAIT